MKVSGFECFNSSFLVDFILGEELCFDTLDFFSKYGFGDGDMLSDFFYEYCDKQGVDRKKQVSIDIHRILLSVIEQEVLPKINPQPEINFITSCHNPIICFDEEYDIEPRYIYVPITRIIKIFDRYIEKV